MRLVRSLSVSVPMIVAAATALRAQAVASTGDGARMAEARALLKALVETNTTRDHGGTTPAARLLADRFIQAGWPRADVEIAGASPTRQNLVVRWRAPSLEAKPVMFMSHLDVVEAKREDWDSDPFLLREKDGYLYGRGVLDDKAAVATWTTGLISLRRAGWRPSRDIVLLLTADEEGGDENGVDWLLRNRRALFDVDFAINAVRIEQHRFPAQLSDLQRGFLTQTAESAPPTVADALRKILADPHDAAASDALMQEPHLNAMLRTTCVATELAGGHAINALPQRATATVNCRVLPGIPPDTIVAQLRRVVADTAVHIVARPPIKPPAAASPMRDDVVKRLTRAVVSSWGASVRVQPTLSPGASDASFTRAAGIPTYTVWHVPLDPSDMRAHGRDERILARSFDESVEFAQNLIREAAGPDR